MTSYQEAVRAADALAEQVQAHVVDPRFTPRYFDRLFGLRTALGSARDSFAAAHAGETEALPSFAKVFDRCEQARAIGGTLSPQDGAVAGYGQAVERAIAALQGGSGSTAGSAGGGGAMLRGTLRLRGDDGTAAAGLRPQRAAATEPYYTSLVKLFPVEAVTLYPLATGIAADDTRIRLALIGVIVVFVVVLRWFATQEAGGGAADVPAIVVAVLAFLLHVASLGGFGHLPGGPEQTRQLLAFVTVMFVALTPFVLRRARR